MMMRGLLIGMVVAACGGTPGHSRVSAPAKRQLHTRLAPPAVGDVFTSERYRTLDAEIDGQEHHETTLIQRSSRIVAVVDGEVTLLDATYASYVQDVRSTGRFENTAPALAGNSYTISLDEPPVVMRDGAEVTGDERQAVLAGNNTSVESREKLLAMRSWPVGEAITLDEFQRAYVGRGSAGSVTFTLIELTDTLATFDLVGEDANIPSLPGVVLTWRSKMHVDPRTGRMLDEELSGVFTGAWTGQLSEQNKWTYAPAAK